MTEIDIRPLQAYADVRLSHYLINTQRGPGFCSVCTAPIEPTYELCFRCCTDAAGGCDLVAPVVYGGHSPQSDRLLHDYKLSWAKGTELRSNMFLLFVIALGVHRKCLESDQQPIDGYIVVPSTSGRVGHPLPDIVQPMLSDLRRIDVMSASATKERVVQTHKFVVPRPEDLDGLRHVLIVDDTWTTGATVQSLARAVRALGTPRVTASVAARWLNPAWAATAEFLAKSQGPLDLSRCPVTGSQCPP